MRLKIRFWDIIAIILSVAATATFTAYFFAQGTGAPQVQIESPAGLFTYPVDRDQTLAIAGSLGVTHVVISGGGVHVSDSPCGNKLCVSMGTISRQGEWLACLPNRVFVRITGGKEDEVDAKAW